MSGCMEWKECLCVDLAENGDKIRETATIEIE